MVNSWTTCRVEEIANINPEQLNSKTDKNLSFDYIDIGSIESTGRLGDTRRLTLSEAPSRAKRILKSEDILVSTVRPYLRGFVQVKNLNYNTVCSTGFTVVRAKSGTDSEFLYQFILSDYFLNQLIPKMTGSNYPAVNASDVGGVELHLPTLAEQRKIAAILTSVDDAIEKTESIIKQTEVVKQGLMQQLLTKGIGHTKFHETEIGKIPYNWEIAKIGEISSFIDYRGKTPVKTEQGVRLLTAKNVRNGYISAEPKEFIAEEDYDTWMTRGIPNLGDILFTTEAPMGNVAQLNISGKVAFTQRVIIIQPNKQIDKKFIKYVLMSENVQEMTSLLSTGTTVKGIKASNLKKIVIPVPPLDEQIKIAKILSSIELKISKENSYLEQMNLVKKSLMQDLLTGKVRVNVDELTEVSV